MPPCTAVFYYKAKSQFYIYTYTHGGVCVSLKAKYSIQGNTVEVANLLCTKMLAIPSFAKECKSKLYQVPYGPVS